MKRFFLLLLILCLLPLTALAGDPSVYCYAVNPDSDTVPIYQNASVKSKKVGDFYVHQPMIWDCWEEDDADGWVKLTEPDVGYIQTKYLVDSFDSEIDYRGADQLPLLIAKEDVPLLSSAGAKAKTLSTLPGGLQLLALGDCGDMYFVTIRWKYTAVTMGSRYREIEGFVRKDDVEFTGETHSLFATTEQGKTMRVYHADGAEGVPYHKDFTRSNVSFGHFESAFVYQDLGEWSVTNYGLLETRFLLENGDHRLPTAYTRTSGEDSRLLMRHQPKKSTDYQAKYFSGVPVFILSQSGDYTQVVVGDSTGWFATDFLTDVQTDRRVQATVVRDVRYDVTFNRLVLSAGTPVTLIGSLQKDMLSIINGKVVRIPLENLMPVDNSGVLEAKTTVRLKMHSTLDEEAENEITLIPKGKKVTVLIHGDTYSKIEYNDKIGYVMTNYLKF